MPTAPSAAGANPFSAAMMWQMQANAMQPNPGMMMPPWALPGGLPPPPMMSSPPLKVRVEGLKFEYQLTEDDVRKVFARYGEVRNVDLDKEGTSATITLAQPHQAIMAQNDLDNKQLSGMSGAFLRVEFAQPDFNPALQAQMAALQAQSMQAMMQPPPASGYPLAAPPQSPTGPGLNSSQSKKCTCKLEIGIENDGDFRVGSRVIQIARQIWQNKDFQANNGKTRLRGKGIGGPHEADEPLALCISCTDPAAFETAVQYAEGQLQKVHNEYRTWCQQHNKPVPELAVKISRKGGGRSEGGSSSNQDPPRGERPANAPTDAEIESYIEERNEARKSQNFERADQVRDYLKQRGVVLMDEKAAKGNLKGKEVTKWRFWRP